MKKCRRYLLVLSLLLFVSCDYWGSFHFIIDNDTDEEVRICYNPQIGRWEDVLPTYEHGPDYELAYSETDTILSIESHYSLVWDIDAGPVGMNFPTEYDTPEAYNISPVWDRIRYVVVGTDTIPADNYSKDKWVRSAKKGGCYYTLKIKP